MSQKKRQQPLVRTSDKKIADPRKVRYGAGHAPARMVRAADAATSDSGAIRFGAGHAPAIFRK